MGINSSSLSSGLDNGSITLQKSFERLSIASTETTRKLIENFNTQLAASKLMNEQELKLVKTFKDVQTVAENMAKSLIETENKKKAIEKESDSRIKRLQSESQSSKKALIDAEKQLAKTLKIDASERAKLGTEYEKELDSNKAALKAATIASKDATDALKNGSAKETKIRARLLRDLDKESAAMQKIITDTQAFSTSLKAGDRSLASFNLSTMNANDSLQKFAMKAGISAASFSMLQKGIKESYHEMIMMADKGLGGSIGQLKMSSIRFALSLEEFANLVNKNRTAINAFGGGVEGVNKFSDSIKKTGKDLERSLGLAGAARAAAEFTNVVSNNGMSASATGFDDITKNMADNFGEFHAMLGENAEEFARHNKALLDSDVTQRKLNTLNAAGQKQYISEIMLRDKNLKYMGWSNEKLEKFNNMLVEMYDPSKNKVEKNIEEAVAFKNSNALLLSDARDKASSGKISQTELDEIVNSINITNQAADNNLSGNSKLNDALMKSQAFTNAARVRQKAQDSSYDTNDYNKMTIQDMAAKTGTLGDAVKLAGDTTGNSKRLGKDLTDKKDDILRKNENMQQASEVFSAIRDVIEQGGRVLSDPWVTLGGGIVAAGVGLFSVAAAAAAAATSLVANSASKILGAGKGIGTRVIGGLAAGGAGTSALAIGSAAAAGYGAGSLLNNYIVDPLTTKLTGSSSLGSYVYDKVNKSPSEQSNTNTNTNIQQSKKLYSSNVASTTKTGKSKQNEMLMMKALEESGVTNNRQKAILMGQLSHESAGFSTTKEFGNDSYFKKYDGRKDLGNNKDGDGLKYKGRGFIQLTGRSNYAAAGKALGIPLIDNPELAEQPEIAAKIATWYLQKTKTKDGQSIMDYAANGDINKVTRMINGGTNGLSDRIAKTEQYTSMFDSQMPLSPPPSYASVSGGAQMSNINNTDSELKKQTQLLVQIASQSEINRESRARSNTPESTRARV